MWFFLPSKKTTPSELAVLFVFIAVVFVILGVAALVLGFRAPVEKHAQAIELERLGAASLGIGVVIAFGFWLYRRLVD